jgi:hypothetical protein
LLGKMSDNKCARKLGRALWRVKRRRIQLRIPVFNSRHHQWSLEDDKLLGVRTDDEIAALLRTSAKAVAHRRRQFNIAPCAKQIRQGLLARAQARRLRRVGGHFGTYTRQEEKLMGTMLDKELAKRLGRTQKAVEARRIQLQIPKFDPKIHQWTPEDDSLLGVVTDCEIASRLGLTVGAVARRRLRLGRGVRFAHRRPWTPQEDALLGTASDTEIAAKLGRKIEVVCMRRQKLGLPNFYWQQRCGRQRKFASA